MNYECVFCFRILRNSDVHVFETYWLRHCICAFVYTLHRIQMNNSLSAN